MKKTLNKIKAFIKNLFGGGKVGEVISNILVPFNTVPKWDECRKSSNWTGRNASTRIMNILSPNMTEAEFYDRYKWAKDRGVDHFNLFITNKADGEKAGYSIYGSSFAQSNGVDKKSTKTMGKRIDKIRDAGFGVVLWMFSDDSNAWAKAVDFEKLCKDVKNLGWFKKCSSVVVGLEVNEYWSAANVSEYCNILRKYSGLKVGVHQTSDRLDFMQYGDLAYLQVAPGTSISKIKAFIAKAKSQTGKPCCMFEMERAEDRERSEAALKAGAFSVGNW